MMIEGPEFYDTFEGGAAEVAAHRAAGRRDRVRHAWNRIEWVAGRDPHMPAPTNSVREMAIESAIRDLLHGSHG